MGETIQLGGGAVLQAGPANVDDCGAFPSGQTSIPLHLLPLTKGYVVSTGRQFYSLNVGSPSFSTLAGVGAAGPVTRAHTIYLCSIAPFVIRLTYSSDVVTKLVYLTGMLLQEVTPGLEITLVEAQGIGNLEFLAVGNS